jgi:transcriptional repressor NrdR
MVGEEVMRELREMDGVAYVRFASVYRDFQDVSEFQKEIQNLTRENPRENTRQDARENPRQDARKDKSA